MYFCASLKTFLNSTFRSLLHGQQRADLLLVFHQGPLQRRESTEAALGSPGLRRSRGRHSEKLSLRFDAVVMKKKKKFLIFEETVESVATHFPVAKLV